MASKKIGALWVRKMKDGTQYMSGVLSDMRGDIPVVVFKNTKKEKENHPDFNIVLSEPKEEGQAESASADILDVGGPVGKEEYPVIDLNSEEIDSKSLPF